DPTKSTTSRSLPLTLPDHSLTSSLYHPISRSLPHSLTPSLYHPTYAARATRSRSAAAPGRRAPVRCRAGASPPQRACATRIGGAWKTPDPASRVVASKSPARSIGSLLEHTVIFFLTFSCLSCLFDDDSPLILTCR